MQFCIGSITKTFIAALVLLLVEENTLSLSDSLHEWLPVYPNIDSTITIEQLLNHTSGVRTWHDHPTLYDVEMREDLSRIWTREELLSRYIPEPHFPPGSGWAYSSTNYIILGLIIKNATGSEPSDLLRQKILTPLGLDDTCHYPDLPSGVVAQGWYDWDEDGSLDGDISYEDMEGYWSLTAEGGAMFSTASDIVRWFHALFHGEVLNQESMDAMLTLVPTPGEMPNFSGYGLGMSSWGPMLFDEENYGHSGAVIGYIGWVQYLPQYDICITQLENDNKYACEMYINGELVRMIQEHFEIE
jgi:D-alanyl-D-alanine carboxypeptidase